MRSGKRSRLLRHSDLASRHIEVRAERGRWCDLSHAQDLLRRRHNQGELVEHTDTSYTYEIIDSPLPVENYRATISVSAEGDRTKVDWKSTFDAKGKSDSEAKDVISGIYKAGLDKIAEMSGN
ncbi:Polyketide cyclase / dehydrase and lipid transport [Rhizobium mongolense subsp. loessense]|uniref:Polyketide cyclase / dehydrase and lipid transport n=1 Tax=Rhizobium mongolense subsp. loessense TaxID=158890 RepID=A0A1G4UBL5_9HYPH|nr:SRPBCC family protein [Rhizobium mongolense]SCW90129.1 Polyketide cyclase / dehydrase and lipid transport [Rhizobium mongolense subsp. loessense]